MQAQRRDPREDLDPSGARDRGERRRAPWAALLALLILALAAALWAARSLLLPFGLGGVLAYMVAPLVDWGEHRLDLPRGVAILLSFLLLGGVIAALGWLIVPDLARELQRLSTTLPIYGQVATQAVNHLRTGYGNLPLPQALRTGADRALTRAENGAESAVTQTLAGVRGLVGLAFSLLLAPVLAFYLLLDLPHLRLEWARLLPEGARQRVLLLGRDLDAVLAGWIRGELVVAAAVATLSTLALVLLGVRFAFILGLVAGVGELIPYFGPFLGAVPAVLVAATGGPRLVLETAAAFLVIQQLEGAFLAPRVVGRAVGLSPLVTIAVLLLGDHWAGIGGVILSVPVAAMLRVLAQHAMAALTSLRPPRRLT